MISNKGPFFNSPNFQNTQCTYKERILRLIDARELLAWIGRDGIVNHLLGVQETNSRAVYHTLIRVISKVCLGSEPGSLTFNEP